MLDAKTVKEAALRNGADLVGIAGIDRFSKLPSEANPKYVKPDAQSVIVLGFRVPRGALRGVEEGTAWQTLPLANPAETICVETTYQLCRELESEGWEAVPIYPHSRDFRNQGVRAHPDKPEPNVILEMEFAAHAAGLGEIGRGGFFLTPDFGPRQVFTAVVTDLALTPDEPFAGSICDDCGACATACPAKALDPERIVTMPLTNGEAKCYALRMESCRVCETGTIPRPYSSDSEPWRIGAACGRACVAHLEDEGRLQKKFHKKFREQPAG